MRKFEQNLLNKCSEQKRTIEWCNKRITYLENKLKKANELLDEVWSESEDWENKREIYRNKK